MAFFYDLKKWDEILTAVQSEWLSVDGGITHGWSLKIKASKGVFQGVCLGNTYGDEEREPPLYRKSGKTAGIYLLYIAAEFSKSKCLRVA